MEYLLIILSCFLCGLINLDNLQIGQFSVSRASAVGLIIGFLNGTPLEGASAGILLELAYATFLPLGGSIPPNQAVASAVAVLVFSRGGGSAAFSFFAGFFSGFAYSAIDFAMRKKRSGGIKIFEERSGRGEIRLNWWIGKFLMEENLAASLFSLSASLVFIAAVPLVKGPVLEQTLGMAKFMIFWAAFFGLTLKFKSQTARSNGHKK